MGFERVFLFLYACALALATVVGVPQPFSMPPLPDEPALLRMVPKDCICAVTWAGAAAPAKDSRNRTELLCAEPEVRRAVAALRSATVGMLDRGGPAGAGIARAGVRLACDAMQQPGCAYVRSIAHRPKKTLEAGIAMHLGSDMATAKALLGLITVALRAQHGGGAELHEDVEVDDVRFRALPTDVEHPFLGWAEVDGWLLVAIGEPVCTQLVQGLRGKDEGLRGAADVQRLLKETAVARPATRAYVDCARLLAALQGMRSDGAGIARLATALGLAHAGAALSTTGLDAEGFTARVHVDVAERTGLLGALSAAPIAQDALLTVPADADLAVAMHFDTAALERGLLELAGALSGGDVQAEYESFQSEFAAHLGVAWHRDLLDHLDGQLAMWDAPSQGGFGVTAAGATLGLADGAKFAASWQTVMARLREQVPSKAKVGDLRRFGRRAYLDSFEHGSTTVHWLDNFDDDFPFAVAAAPAPTALALGMTPNTVRDALDALAAPNPDRSLLRWPHLNRRGNASALVHLDLRSLLTASWPLLAPMMQAATGEWQREGFDFDAADLPRPSVLLPLLGRELILVEPTAKGIAWVRTGTVPVFDPLLLAGAVAVGVLLAD
jgi:hypothetical protein